MVNVAEKKPDVGIVTCKVYYQSSPAEIFAASGKMNWWLCAGVNQGSHIKIFQKSEEERYSDFACGVLLLMRKEMLDLKGMFNEKYFMYLEDVEYSRRILPEFKIFYTPLGIAYHKSGGGKGWRTYTELYLYYHTRNRIWAFQSDPFLYRCYVMIFTFCNASLKSMVFLSNIWNDYHRVVGQIQSLWRGFGDGFIKE